MHSSSEGVWSQIWVWPGTRREAKTASAAQQMAVLREQDGAAGNGKRVTTQGVKVAGGGS